jgi:hypothetical protein
MAGHPAPRETLNRSAFPWKTPAGVPATLASSMSADPNRLADPSPGAWPAALPAPGSLLGGIALRCASVQRTLPRGVLFRYLRNAPAINSTLPHRCGPKPLH